MKTHSEERFHPCRRNLGSFKWDSHHWNGTHYHFCILSILLSSGFVSTKSAKAVSGETLLRTLGSCLWDDQVKKPMKVHFTASWHCDTFLSPPPPVSKKKIDLITLISPQQGVTAAASFPHRIRQSERSSRSAAADIKLTSDALDVDRSSRRRAEEEREARCYWRKGEGSRQELSPAGGCDGWSERAAAGRLSRPCLWLLRLFLPFLSQLQQAFLHLRLPGENSPSAHLHADRNIANSESSLIASSASQHLASPSPRREPLRSIGINLSNVVGNVSLPSTRDESLTVQLAASDYRSQFLETCSFICWLPFHFRAKCRGFEMTSSLFWDASLRWSLKGNNLGTKTSSWQFPEITQLVLTVTLGKM